MIFGGAKFCKCKSRRCSCAIVFNVSLFNFLKRKWYFLSSVLFQRAPSGHLNLLSHFSRALLSLRTLSLARSLKIESFKLHLASIFFVLSAHKIMTSYFNYRKSRKKVKVEFTWEALTPRFAYNRWLLCG